MNYQDNETRIQIKEDIKECKCLKDIVDLIDQYYPEWLVTSIDGYSEDYPQLTKNWNIVCEKMGVTPKKIILVKEIKFSADYKIMEFICDFMTRNGYCVRRETEFVVCPDCNKAIPVESVHSVLKKNKSNVPLVWRSHCRNCKLN
jgi:hypothetical protein